MNEATPLPHLLTDAELEELTRYEQPSKQLAFLHKQGFYRASMHRGQVWLERAHFLAVARGEAANDETPKVKVRLNIRPKAATQ